MTIRYEFQIKTPENMDGFKASVDMNIINHQTARNHIKRLFPTATQISYIRSYRIN